MWQPETVERILFRWVRWRRSLIREWSRPEQIPETPLSKLEEKAHQVLDSLDLPSPPLLELYWISCVHSDLNLDYERSYNKIAVPFRRMADMHSLLTNYELKNGTRVYPPVIVSEADLRFEARQYGIGSSVVSRDGSKHRISLVEQFQHMLGPGLWILLPDEHELRGMLTNSKGRPPRSQGRSLRYSDRLAVRCAALKNSGKTYVEVAEQCDLPVTEPYSSRQSDVTRHLVKRGMKLLGEVG